MPDWDAYYVEKSVDNATASRVLVENSHLLPAHGVALDYACGLGGNAKYLAQKGFEVLALDNSEVAVDKINQYATQQQLMIKAETRDLEADTLEYEAAFDVIVVGFFLHRETLPMLEKMLKPGGLLFYQTFSGPQLSGVGPSNPKFRLHRGELLQVFKDMQLLVYHEAAYQSEENSMADQVLFLAKK